MLRLVKPPTCTNREQQQYRGIVVLLMAITPDAMFWIDHDCFSKQMLGIL